MQMNSSRLGNTGGGAAVNSGCKQTEQRPGFLRGCLKLRCLEIGGYQEISLTLPTEVQKKGLSRRVSKCHRKASLYLL